MALKSTKRAPVGPAPPPVPAVDAAAHHALHGRDGTTPPTGQTRADNFDFPCRFRPLAAERGPRVIHYRGRFLPSVESSGGLST